MEENITELLERWSEGDGDALPPLGEAVERELHEIAERLMRRERVDHTLQPTALVNEAYIRLVAQDRMQWQNRAQFFAVAARIMRRILVDHARRVQALRRGGTSRTISLDGVEIADGDIDVLMLDDSLRRLAEMDEQQGSLVELKFFGGLTNEETADVLGVSARTIKRGWASARAWLAHDLSPAP